MTNGFVLGKFMPPHAGHLHLIRTAAGQCDQVFVLVCTIGREPIPGYLRYHWMQQLFANEPSVHLIHITDENPQEPPDHPGFWAIWLDTIRRNIAEPIHLVFTSEDYGDELAARLGAEHVRVDTRQLCSGTRVRTNPMAEWEHIPEPVRPYYLKRVVLTGPESVGKSVLARKLAEHYHTSWLPEYGREYYEQVMPDFTYEGISHIAAGHLLREEEIARTANRLLFLDTDLMATQVWSEIYFGRCPQWVLEASHQQRADLYLLLAPDINWIDDGTRNYGHIRTAQFERLRHELELRRLPYQVVSGDYEMRFDQAVRAVNKAFPFLESALPPPPETSL